jgi:hypothetical protein
MSTKLLYSALISALMITNFTHSINSPTITKPHAPIYTSHVRIQPGQPGWYRPRLLTFSTQQTPALPTEKHAPAVDKPEMSTELES